MLSSVQSRVRRLNEFTARSSIGEVWYERQSILFQLDLSLQSHRLLHDKLKMNMPGDSALLNHSISLTYSRRSNIKAFSDSLGVPKIVSDPLDIWMLAEQYTVAHFCIHRHAQKPLYAIRPFGYGPKLEADRAVEGKRSC